MWPIRTFLAIPVSTEKTEAIAAVQEKLQQHIGGIRWSRPETLHLTMHFFGSTTQENLEKIKASMLSVKRYQRRFTVAMKGLGGFPDDKRPKVIWLGMEPKEKLKKLYWDIQQELRKTGLPQECRPYTPHLTIGRVHKGKADLSKATVTYSDTTIGDLEIDKLILYESKLQPGGAEHIPILTVNFDEETDNLS